MTELPFVLVLALRASLAMLFGLSALHKLRDFGAFAGTVGAYVRGTLLERSSLVWVVAATTLVFELAVVALLASADLYRLGGWLSAIMLIGYGTAIAVNLWRGNNLLDCGCSWGSERQPATSNLVIRNAVLASLAVILTLPAGIDSVSLTDLLLAAAFSGLLAIFYLTAEQLIANAWRLEERA